MLNYGKMCLSLKEKYFLDLKKYDYPFFPHGITLNMLFCNPFPQERLDSIQLGKGSEQYNL